MKQPRFIFPGKNHALSRSHVKRLQKQQQIQDQLETWPKIGGKKWGTTVKHLQLGGGFKRFLFSPLPGEMIQFDNLTNIFQGGWNLQLDKMCGQCSAKLQTDFTHLED